MESTLSMPKFSFIARVQPIFNFILLFKKFRGQKHNFHFTQQPFFSTFVTIYIFIYHDSYCMFQQTSSLIRRPYSIIIMDDYILWLLKKKTKNQMKSNVE